MEKERGMEERYAESSTEMRRENYQRALGR
jgi:hypothetical protein